MRKNLNRAIRAKLEKLAAPQLQIKATPRAQSQQLPAMSSEEAVEWMQRRSNEPRVVENKTLRGRLRDRLLGKRKGVKHVSRLAVPPIQAHAGAPTIQVPGPKAVWEDSQYGWKKAPQADLSPQVVENKTRRGRLRDRLLGKRTGVKRINRGLPPPASKGLTRGLFRRIISKGKL